MSKIPTDQLLHVGVVVRDVRAAAQRYAQIYGIQDWAVTGHTESRLTGATAHGFSSTHSFVSATGRAETAQGTYVFRLIQPTGGWSTYQEFLLARGEGVHHLCTGKLSHAAYAELQAWLTHEGVEIAQTSCLDDQFTEVTLDTRASLGGFYIQLLVTGSDVHEPAPDETLHFDVPRALLPLGTFQVHFGVVVRDAVQRARDWHRLLGVSRFAFMDWHTAPGSLEDPYYLGKPVHHAYFGALVTLNPMLTFELVQSTFGPTHYKEDFLNIVGEGIHHLNATMLQSKDHLRTTTQELAGFGIHPVMGGDIAGAFAGFCYFDTRSQLGYVTEVTYPGKNFDKGADAIPIGLVMDLSNACQAL